MQDAACPLVLVVEDDEDIRSVLTMALSQSYRAKAVGTGQDAIAEARAIRPDVVVLDWTLPDMTGDELIAAVHNLGPVYDQVRWVLVSGVAGVRGLADRMGAIACPKPCTIDGILESIEKALVP